MPNGLVLVTGPTGTGKTTTLNFMIDVINRERRAKIVTIEDPVEFVHENQRSIIVQQEVHTDTPSFRQALVHVLRQDPDVIVVGEMRDLETIASALTAAETGHLVLATLHTPDAVQTIQRVYGVFPAEQQNNIRYQMSNALQAIVAQMLLPRADGKGLVLACEICTATPAVPQTHPRRRRSPAVQRDADRTQIQYADHGPLPAEPVPAGRHHLRHRHLHAREPNTIRKLRRSFALGAVHE